MFVKMEMETACREPVKPSSPTPPHLKTFRLCLLDQMTPMFYTPLVLLYHVDRVAVEHASVPIASLESSLSDAFALFYPFAGRLDGRENLSIDCNNAGALYVETRVDGDLLEFLRDPDIVRCLNRIIPLHGISDAPAREAHIMGVQANVFRCGGIALGASFSQKIIDGVIMSAFLNSWAVIARGSPEEVIHAECTTASTLSPGNPVMPSHMPAWIGSPFVKEVKSCPRRFMFYSAALSALRGHCSGAACDSPRPTRIEALAGFILIQAIKASKAITGTNSPSTATLSVNLQRLVRMPEPETGFPIGNISWKAFADFDSEDESTTAMTGLIREAVVEVNKESFEKLKGKGGYSGIERWLEKATKRYRLAKTCIYTFVSWCNMGFYEVDFGWGKPGWISTSCFGDVAFKNVVMFTDVPSRGIEALIVLEEKEMDVLENDPEFIKFATPNPTIST